MNADPTAKDGQFCDRGNQYRSAIFYHDEDQKRLAEASKTTLIESGRVKEIFTEITEASAFYPAEDYHQDYHKKNPLRYTSTTVMAAVGTNGLKKFGLKANNPS